MEKKGSHMTERILDLTLEVVYLLTGENYIAFKLSNGLVATNVKKTQSLGIEPLSQYPRKNKKIEEVTNEIIELLMGEVTLDENQIDHRTQAKEGVEELHVRFEEPCMEEKRFVDIGTDPGDTRDTQRDIKAEEEEEEHVRIKVEDIPLEISKDGTPNRKNVERFSFITEDGKTEEDEIIYGEDNVTPNRHLLSFVKQNRHLVHPSVNLSSNPFTHQKEAPNFCPPLSQHTFSDMSDAFMSSDRGECFTQGEDLTTHSRLHTEEKPYSCSDCGKCFTRRAYLAKHERIHVGLTPFSCSECGKCFTRRTNLINHQRTHTGVKPYSCAECGKCFTWRTTYIEHQRSHTGVKPYSCSVCGKCFSLYSAYSKHQKIHTGEKPYSCAECGRHFTRSDHLVIHQRTHTGEKPYSCDKCGKRFNEKARLVSHQVVHTGVHPYSCSICGKGFITNARLVKHQQVHLSLQPHAWTE